MEFKALKISSLISSLKFNKQKQIKRSTASTAGVNPVFENLCSGLFDVLGAKSVFFKVFLRKMVRNSERADRGDSFGLFAAKPKQAAAAL